MVTSLVAAASEPLQSSQDHQLNPLKEKNNGGEPKEPASDDTKNINMPSIPAGLSIFPAENINQTQIKNDASSARLSQSVESLSSYSAGKGETQKSREGQREPHASDDYRMFRNGKVWKVRGTIKKKTIFQRTSFHQRLLQAKKSVSTLHNDASKLAPAKTPAKSNLLMVSIRQAKKNKSSKGDSSTDVNEKMTAPSTASMGTTKRKRVPSAAMNESSLGGGSATGAQSTPQKRNKKKHCTPDSQRKNKTPTTPASSEPSMGGSAIVPWKDKVSKKNKQGKPVYGPPGPVVHSIGQWDVLLGRGQNIANSTGNQRFRKLIWNNRRMYQSSPRFEKNNIAEAIFMYMTETGARFLENEDGLVARDGGTWRVAPHGRAIEKICQGLRELKWSNDPSQGPTCGAPVGSYASKMSRIPQRTYQFHNKNYEATIFLIENDPCSGAISPDEKNTKKAASGKSKKATKAGKRTTKKGKRPTAARAQDNTISIMPKSAGVLVGTTAATPLEENLRVEAVSLINRKEAAPDVAPLTTLNRRSSHVSLLGSGAPASPVVQGGAAALPEMTTAETTIEPMAPTKDAAGVPNNATLPPTDAVNSEKPNGRRAIEEGLFYTRETTVAIDAGTPLASMEEKATCRSSTTSPAERTDRVTRPMPPKPAKLTKSVKKEAASKKEKMAKLREGSRVHIYWPLDEVFYSGTVEDQLQGSFFYIKYDDGESEWLDLNKHEFRVVGWNGDGKSGADENVSEGSIRKGRDRGEGAPRGKAKAKPDPIDLASIEIGGTGLTEKSVQVHEQILAAVSLFGDGFDPRNNAHWAEVALMVPGIDGKECRRRWELNMDPSFSREPFTREELQIILDFQQKAGNRWVKLSPHMERRSSFYLCFYWNRKIRPIVLQTLRSFGYSDEQIEGDSKKIKYHGLMEEVLDALVKGQG